ncbi:hypothetical protein [Caldifermentibacillus hisashii]|uniref:hypothetical protein n=1 Tax=Caldifermentibacillus hisashii TaxID=996558 RepID=UPI0022B96F04|nr:hypothetical protein [Caldifermentibacillus hisashii]
MKTHASRQFQENIDQYKMPEALKTSKKGHYRVGYEATTGNNTDIGKKQRVNKVRELASLGKLPSQVKNSATLGIFY